MFTKTTLKNGLRVITVPDGNTKAVTVLVVVGAGSKYETEGQNGISHFLEHMFFKGTKKRPGALQITEALDKVGGIYNAFTSKEFTGYFAKVAKKQLDLALDWVSDIFLHSKLETKKINKEKGVIIEEINMRLDMPMQYVGVLWEKLLYGSQPAGWDIIGERENISGFQRRHFLGYLESHYSSQNTIVCVAGNFSQQQTIEKVKKYFRAINQKPPQVKVKVVEVQRAPQSLLYFKKTDQTHLCLGVRGYHALSPQRYAQGVLATILGGNMSSRLFMEIREKQGLAYYIRTSPETYTDSGYLVTQAGVPHRAAKKVAELILKEYRKIRDKGPSKQELKKAKDYLKGTLTLSLEASDEQASFYAGQEIITGKILTLEEQCAKIDKVNTQEIKKVAQDIFEPEVLNLALIGPHKNKLEFEELLKL